jgi:hypothetical protein
MWEPRRLTTVWDFTACYRGSLPFFYSLADSYQRFGVICCLHHGTLKMEEACSSEMLVTTYKTTHCNNPEDHNINVYRRESLKYKIAEEWLSRTSRCERIQADEFPVCIHSGTCFTQKELSFKIANKPHGPDMKCPKIVVRSKLE